MTFIYHTIGEPHLRKIISGKLNNLHKKETNLECWQNKTFSLSPNAGIWKNMHAENLSYYQKSGLPPLMGGGSLGSRQHGAPAGRTVSLWKRVRM